MISIYLKYNLQTKCLKQNEIVLDEAIKENWNEKNFMAMACIS